MRFDVNDNKWSFFRTLATASASLLALLLPGLAMVAAQAQTAPPVVLNQTSLVGAFPAGGAYGSGTAAGVNVAVDKGNNLFFSTSYGGSVAEAVAATGTIVTLGSTDNPGPIAIDHSGNLYIADVYNNSVIRLPLVNGAYPALTSVASAPPACTGNDAVECLVTLSSAVGGYEGLIFDAAGNLYFSTGNESTATPSAIYECTAASLSTPTPACTAIYTEPSGSNLYVGPLAVDPYGNLFFTDSLLTSVANEQSSSSNLKELAFTGGAFSTTPSTLYTLTPTSIAAYNDQLQGVATDASGNVYFSTVNEGIFAFTNTNGTLSATPYTISTTGAKTLGTNGKGLFYIAGYSNTTKGDAISTVNTANLTVPATAVGTPSTASVEAVLNDGGCTPTPTVTLAATQNGAASPEFTAQTSGSCSASLVGDATFTASVSFSPTASGPHIATLTATDSASNTGGALVSGTVTGSVATPVLSVGTGTYTTAQTVSISDSTTGASIYYTTDGLTTPTASSTPYSGPITVSSSETLEAVAIASGSANSTAASATYTLNLPATAAPTFSLAGGTYTGSQTVTLSDATSGASIYYTTDGSTPTASSTPYSGSILVAQSETVKAVAVASGDAPSAVASAVYTISTAGVAPGVVLSQTTLVGAFPAGGSYGSGTAAGVNFAVDPAGDLFFSTSYGNSVAEVSAATGKLTTLGSTDNPGPVAIDASGNLYIGDVYNNSVIKLPLVSGAYPAFSSVASAPPACTGTDTVECLVTLSSAVSGYEGVIFDAAGNLYFSTGNESTSTPSAIYECTAASLATAAPACTAIYTEPSGSNLFVGPLAVDPAGNVFFTDSLLTSIANEESSSSNLKELAFTGGAFSATPATLYTLTPGSVGAYNDQLQGVATDANGTVYFSTVNEGIFAFTNSNGVIGATPYTVAPTGTKTLGTNGKGLLYVAGYNSTAGGDAISTVNLATLTAPSSPQGSPSTATINVALNDVASCAGTPTVTFTSTTADFSAATSGTCASSLVGGSSTPATITFTPSTSAAESATLTATDSSGGTGAVTVDGLGLPQQGAATPSFSVPAGTYTTIQTVTLSDNTAGATIYYTLDGTTPTASSTVYSGPITVSATETINALATAPNFANSTVGTAAYTINLPPVATPTFTPAAGTYTTIQTVSIADTTGGAAIYFTTDGTTPTTSSPAYTGPITVSATETLNALAVATGYSNSVGTALYTINLPVVATPTFSVAAGTYTAAQTVSLADATAGATIYYTTDGSTPSASSTPYTAPIAVGATETINAIAVEAGYSNSAVATAAYTLNIPVVATPTFSPLTGTYAAAQPVTIVETTAGATIYYTTDGSTPTTSSTVYSGPITVSATETINAIATVPGDINSAVGTVTITIPIVPNYTVSASASSVTVAPGAPGTVTISVTPQNGFSGAVTFACVGYMYCSFSPASVTPSGGVATTTLTLTYGSMSMLRHGSTLLPGVTLAFALCFFGFRRRRSLQVLLVLTVGVLGLGLLSGCGSSTPKASTTPVTVVATSGSLQQTVTFNVTQQ